jgi:hypothetical protein
LEKRGADFYRIRCGGKIIGAIEATAKGGWIFQSASLLRRRLLVGE